MKRQGATRGGGLRCSSMRSRVVAVVALACTAAPASAGTATLREAWLDGPVKELHYVAAWG